MGLAISSRRMVIKMKKLIATFLCLLVLSVAVIPVGAQTRTRRQQSRTSAQQRRYDQNRYDQSRYDGYRERSVWDKHRDKITTGGGALGGAIIGGLIGGKKGAIIGALGGGGGAALYTYNIRKKNRNY